MKRAALCLLLAGCGLDVEGTYRGGMSITGTCSDGSSGGDPGGDVVWRITEKDDVLTIDNDGSCDPHQADLDDERASLRSKTCPDGATSTGVPIRNSVVGGTLNFDDNSMAVEMNMLATAEGTTCTLTARGTLTKD